VVPVSVSVCIALVFDDLRLRRLSIDQVLQLDFVDLIKWYVLQRHRKNLSPHA
jgi:hypothetical protein